MIKNSKQLGKKFSTTQQEIDPNLPLELNTKIRGELSTSHIRLLNIGKNYFRHINPRRKKILMDLLNSYFKQFEEKEEILTVLDLYYNNDNKGNKFSDLNTDDMEFSESILWHLHSLIILDRIASQYSRYEFMEYDQIINSLNALPKEKRNKAKYIFTNQPNQPNSMNQLYCINEILKGLEENDLGYLEQAMILFRHENLKREFKRPTLLEEFITFYSSCIPNLILSFSNMYELGLKDLHDFYEIPETLFALDSKDRDNVNKLSIISYIHGLNMNITIDQYICIIVEAEVEKEMGEILENLKSAKDYANILMHISDKYRYNSQSNIDFFLSIPVSNITGIESHVRKCLIDLKGSSDRRVKEICKKLLSLLNVFGLVGVNVQVKLSGEDLKIKDPKNLAFIKPWIHDILKEISILNSNVNMANMIIFEYENLTQYDILQDLLEKYQMSNVEIVPLIKKSKFLNDTNSNITLISCSHSRQHEGLLLTELRHFREYKNNPKKWIYMGQGNTAERGGGPFGLTHQKYNSLTRVQRERHIRTIQGYYFTSEFCSKDLIFAFLLNGANHLSIGDHFEPTTEYMDFLFELDSVIGHPQREMQKSNEFNELYTNNPIVRTLAENFDYAGYEDAPISFDSIKDQSGIVESYVYSDRCSFTHPELAFWDRLDENLIKKMAKTYYDNNRHFKFILYTYAFMLKRSDLEFARSEVGLDQNNPVFINYMKGRNALEKILINIGLDTSSTNTTHIYNQHLGLLTLSSKEENNQKFDAYRMLFILQNYYLRKYLKFKKLDNEEISNSSLKKMKILQSALANISSFNGKG
jgi:hypothetical protein